MKEYPVLSNEEFIDKYGPEVESTARFITKAFSHKDNTVAVFPNETKVDCYFQLPQWKEDTVPYDRRFIYVLPKNSIPDNVLVDGERYKIRVSELKVFKDPYLNSSILEEDDGLTKGKDYEITKELVIEVLKDMISKYESRN